MRKRTDEVFSVDVLVIGGGAAACSAAVAAKREGVDVLVLDKGELGKSGCSPNAHGGMAVYPKDKKDNWKIHAEDTLMSGGFLNDQEIVKILCQQGYDRVQRLERYGALFNRENDGSYSVRQFGGHRYKRSVFSGDETGHEMMNGLKREMARLNINVKDEVMVTKLLVDDGEIAGALAWDLSTGRIIEVRTDAVILATADAGGLWPSASERQRGDGSYLALEAGAELTDMEFMQYHPTHAWWPFGVRGSISESFRSEGGYLLNSEGERFMKRYDPEKMELATRDKVSVSIYREILAGRGASHGGIYLSATHFPTGLAEKRLRVIFLKFMRYGYDIRKRAIEVKPRPHYHCGGVVIDTNAETKIIGLFAAGAVTAGVHGANRLGSNALVDILVFGLIAGEKAAFLSKNKKNRQYNILEQVDNEIRRIETISSNNPDKPIFMPQVRRKHWEMMDRCMGVLRTEEGIKEMAAEIDRSKKEDRPALTIKDKGRIFNYEMQDALELDQRLIIEDIATKAALARKESRGSHFREDYPKRNDKQWLKNIVFWKQDGEIISELRDVKMSVMKIEDLPEYAAQDSPWH